MFQLDQQFTLVIAQVLGNKFRSHLLEIIDPRSEFLLYPWQFKIIQFGFVVWRLINLASVILFTQ